MKKAEQNKLLIGGLITTVIVLIIYKIKNKPKPQETSDGIYDSATHKFVGGPEQ
jgi:hypothetical protein